MCVGKDGVSGEEMLSKFPWQKNELVSQTSVCIRVVRAAT